RLPRARAGGLREDRLGRVAVGELPAHTPPVGAGGPGLLAAVRVQRRVRLCRLQRDLPAPDSGRDPRAGVRRRWRRHDARHRGGLRVRGLPGRCGELAPGLPRRRPGGRRLRGGAGPEPAVGPLAAGAPGTAPARHRALTSMRAAAIVINSTLARDLGRFRRRCREAAAAGGCEPSFLETTLDERGLGRAGPAVAAGARLVVAAGGDGTVRACAQALAGTQVPLGIVPLGTANLAARALGIPPRLGGSLAAAFGGHERRIDLAVAGAAAGDAGAAAGGGAAGRTSAAMAGIGLDAEVVAATPRLLKRRAGWLAYAVAGA